MDYAESLALIEDMFKRALEHAANYTDADVVRIAEQFARMLDFDAKVSISNYKYDAETRTMQVTVQAWPKVIALNLL